MKFFIYARKSTDDEERQILSIQAQLDELRELARKESLTVAREYIEAQTAKEPGRLVFNDMMKALEKGEAQAVLSWHPDRLARNSIDGGRVIYDLDTGKLVTLKFPTFWFENTPQGKFMLQIAFGQSKYYVDNLSENIKRGIRKKLRDGIYPNKPPIGYLNDPKTRAILIDPERGPLVRKMFETYATGQYTASAIKELVTAWGLKTFNDLPLPLSKVLWTLDQVFYIGLFRFNGEVYEGKHPPLISRDLFERVQRIRKNKGRGRYVKHNRFPFRGLITCHVCGCSFTSDTQKGHDYYRCGKRRGPCGLKTIREEALAQLLRASIRRVSISDAWADKMLAEVDRWTMADTVKQADLVARQKVELARITARLDRLLEVFVDGTIGKDEFTGHKEKLTHEKTALAQSITDFEAKGVSRFKPLADFITASKQAKYDAQTAELEELRNWHKRIGSNLIFAGAILEKKEGEREVSAAEAASRSESASGDSSGMTTYRSGDSILSNVCPLVVAEPAYSNGLINAVTYRDDDGSVIANLSVLPGSRIYRMTDGSGNLMDETHYLSNPTNHTDEIWHGVTTNPSLSVAKKVIRQETFDASNMLATLTETVILNPDTTDASSNVTVTVSKQFSWGQEPLSVTTGYGSPDPQTTYYTWYTNAADTGSCGRLQLVENPDRSWRKHSYDQSGSESVILMPFEDAAPDSATNECRVTRNYYAGDSILSSLNFPSDVTFTNDQRPRLVVEEAAGYEVSRTYYAYFSGYAVTKQCRSSGAAYDDVSNLVSTTYFNTNGVGNGRPSRIEHANGTLTAFSYDYDSGADQLTTTEDNGAGTTSVTNGTRTATIRNAADLVLSTTMRDIASDILVSSVTNTYDNRGRIAISSNTVSGVATEYTYACCDAPESVRDADGILTEYVYDDLKQVYTSARLGVTTYFSYDESGHIIATRKSASGVDDIVTAAVYDKSGRLIAATNELGNVTVYAHGTNSSGERVVTATYPDTSTRVETFYRDGRLKLVDGSAEHAHFYEYGTDGDGAYTIEYQGSNSSASAWVKSCINVAGQVWKTVFPDGYTRTVAFDAKGRPVKESDGLTTTLTEYDGNSEPYRTAVDMNENDAVDLAGNDRIAETLIDHTTFDSKDVRETTTQVYPTIGSSTPLVVSLHRRAVDGSAFWSVAYGRTNRTDIARNAATASRTETTTQPDGAQVVSHFTNGILKAVVRKAGGGVVISTTSYGHDPFGRANSITEPAPNGQTRTTTIGYDAAGNTTSTVVSAGTLSQTTSFEYDSMNRRTKTILPDGGEVNYMFTQKGELSGQNGARVYPVTYTFDGQGRLATLSTYRDGLSGSSDVTAWQYDPQRGWLTAKVFADGTSNSYEYLQNGLLKKRTWARDVATEYAFDASGSLTNVNYSDATPDVLYSLDRLGRAVEITDGIGTWTNTYRANGQLESEAFPQQPGWRLEYGQDAFSRMTNIVIRDETSSIQYQALYTYDSAGRIGSVGDGTHTASYFYAPDGSTWTNMSYGGPLNVRRSFDGLGRLTQISNLPSNAAPISFSYSYNQADQRVTNALADGSRWAYAYDALGQVVSAKKFFSDGVPVGGAQFEYEFDTIGNRKTAKNLMGTSSLIEQYTANQLNQYESRTVPGKVLVTGEAATNTTVNVRLDENSTAKLANRHDGYFWQVLNTDNTSALVATTNLQVRAFMAAIQGTNTNSLVRAETRQEVVPQTPEAFTHDADGNLLQEGRWSYSWDAENRLTNVESIVDVPDRLRRRLVFGYDYQSRRTTKMVYSGFDGADYTATSVTEFIWNGWNLIGEISSAGTTNYYLHGLDLGGKLHGAGGVGGLAAILLNGTNCLTASDANGNVAALVDASAGSISAQYEWSPFGVILRAAGPVAKANPVRWSTKYTDDETGLVMYPQRSFNPSTGRWLARDPIGEGGGDNLYSFVGNDSIDLFDPLGEDFIAVGKRPLANKVAGVFFSHMSIELYEQNPCLARKGTKFKPADLGKAELANAKRVAQYQLLPSGDYKKPITATIPLPGGKTISKTFYRPVLYGISFIHPTSSATELAIIYADSVVLGDATKQWNRIDVAAKNYPYAEQLPVGGPLAKWPNSTYQRPPGNNSNSFVYQMANEIGESAAVFNDTPGAVTPSPVIDPDPAPVYYP